MPQPTVTDVHIDQPISNLVLAQIQSQVGFVAGDVFPIIPVTHKSDKYYTFEVNAFARDDVTPRAPGDRVSRIGYQVANDGYSCVNKAVGTEIYDQIRDNTDEPLDLEGAAAQLLASQWTQHLERTWASKYFTTGIYGSAAVGGFGVGTELAGVTTSPTAGQFRRWDDQVNSNPIGDIRAAIRTFQVQSGGIKPNRLVLAAKVADALIDHPDIVDRIKYTETAMVDPQMVLTALARLFQIEKVVVAEGVKATNNEGGTAAYDFIQDKHALLAYRPANPGLMVPMTGAIFVWRNFGNTGLTMPTKRWRDESTASDVLESEAAFDMKVCSKSLGLLFANAIS